ncbi:MAG: zinc ribbon domain-containing protein [Chloroflexi bacterium]|nr:zinc ribbon domain-containing protein [Chloroflexota bacterium]
MQTIFELIRTLIAPATQVMLALGGAYLATLWVVLILWTFRDIESRSRSLVTQIFATLLTVFFFIPGVLLYLILRPKETLDETFQRALQEEYLLQDLEELPLCPACRHYVQADFVLCPHCHSRLRENCPSCQRLVDLRWDVCPYCANPLPGPDESLVEPTVKVEPPRVPAWVSPALERLRARLSGQREPAGAAVELAPTSAAPPAEIAVDLTAAELARNGHHPPADAAVPPRPRPRPRTRATGGTATVEPPAADVAAIDPVGTRAE